MNPHHAKPKMQNACLWPIRDSNFIRTNGFLNQPANSEWILPYFYSQCLGLVFESRKSAGLFGFDSTCIVNHVRIRAPTKSKMPLKKYFASIPSYMIWHENRVHRKSNWIDPWWIYFTIQMRENPTGFNSDCKLRTLFGFCKTLGMFTKVNN